jgi:tripartite-type tricarboxylate transporter receptor subunit TctC
MDTGWEFAKRIAGYARMRKRSRRLALISLLAVGLPYAASRALVAQEYPSRPIEFVVPWGPGGGADQLARKLAKLMEPRLRVSMPIVNVPGATGQTGLTKLLTAPADGYAIAVFVGPTFALQAGKPPPKWTMHDIEPLGVVVQQTSAFLVAEEGRFKTWADVEQAAKVERVRVAITGFGSDDDLTVGFLAQKGLRLLSVPMPKPGERYAAVVGGHAEVLYEQVGDVRSLVDGKQLRPVLFFSERRDAAFPGVPTSLELGYDVTQPQFRAVVVRSGTDAKIVSKLADALADAVRDPEYVAFLKDQHADPGGFLPAAKSRAYLDRLLDGTKALVAKMGAPQQSASPEQPQKK